MILINGYVNLNLLLDKKTRSIRLQWNLRTARYRVPI